MNRFYKSLLVVFFIFFLSQASFGQTKSQEPGGFKFNLDVNSISNQLAGAPVLLTDGDGRSQAIKNGINVQIPLPSGKYLTFYLLEASVFSKELAKEHTYIKTYKAFEANGESVGRITIFKSEIDGFFVTDYGNVIIKPKTSSEGNYESFFEQSDGVMENCEIEGIEHIKKSFRESFGISGFSNGSILKTYRIAIVTTAEFFTNNGSTQPSAMAELTSTVGALSTLYETEVGISFTLVAAKIYEDAASDPFDPSGQNRLDETQDAFTALAGTEPANFGTQTYDIGHTLHYSGGGGGIANLGNVCSSTHFKSRGWSGVSSTYRGTFFHEVAHQFNAGHTFNSIQNGCNGNIMTGSAFEPGSGSTIMSYFGSCSPDNLSGGNGFSRSYFHTNSLESIISFSSNIATCYTSSASGNTAPSVNANPSGNPIVIPKGTPFTLTGSGSDTEALTYTWEQYDLGDLRGAADDVAATTDSPIFRSLSPTENGFVRTFPRLSVILKGSSPSNDEALPTVARAINMRLTARDNNLTSGGTTSADVAITVADSGPFSLSTGNVPTLWFEGESKTITWDVNNTDQSPVNCSTVNLLISYDGGATFASLVANTPNDGSENIIVPNTVSSEVRIKIGAVNNIFFDINDVNISITDGSCMAAISSITPDTATEGVVGSTNLSLAAIGEAFTSFSGTLDSTDSSSNLVFKDTGGGCGGPSNENYFDVYNFYVAQAGDYEFTYTGDAGFVMNLYSNEFDASSVCSNWLGSSAEMNPADGYIYMSDKVSVNLPIGVYQIVMSNFGNYYSNYPTLPASYTINITQGTVYPPLPALESPYDYTYLATNTSSGLIEAIDSNSDFRTLSLGNYRVYGLSFGGGADLSSYVDNAFSTLESDISNDIFCGKLSSNFKDLEVTGCPGFPNPPVVADTTIDYGEMGTLTATGCSGIVSWFNVETGGTSISTGNSFTSPALTESKTYYASCTETCESTTRANATINLNPSSYCDASGLNCGYDDAITYVSLNLLSNELFNHSSGCSSGGFTLIDISEISLERGQTYILSVSKGTTYSDALSVWVDFNGNGVFESFEMIWEEAENYIETQSKEFTVPELANLGEVRMRIRLEDNPNKLTACHSETTNPYGEVEDYIFSIVAPLNPCESNVTLTSPSNDFSSETAAIQASDSISGINHISGGNITYDAGKSIVLLPGFVVNPSAENDAVFLAKIGGCE
ncbi:M12 family metallo-peptidase [Arcticibacterium luteifluviistationis]|uniref:Peptidase M12B domain-containing protein n=1 Tax=Arcticibacterium luteifluviistationis TaxID=1784714 RepID=A0A2Z4GAJ1_9BACT|nr:M12 family metallo-peptidase [Arcticibacterium luteifluviistationis]AWV98226.1 hypothetical protein DJ013_08600 [Arcticibacterium luteifluviistationis]